MTIQEWQAIFGLIIGASTVAGIVFAILRFYIKSFAKQELEDIRHELKPNSGSSMKDQVTRLEQGYLRLEDGHLGIKRETEKVDAKLQDMQAKFENRLQKMDEKIDYILEALIRHIDKG